ncbi:DHHC family palmitoyl transferase with a signal peptide and 4 transmembrane domains [Cryptosporidium sp. chipmunk genotype I]|uniref:DHHC family palmitoyl transferase with a signal peptide and 4 transmembrane domains n=1 Tax=Cryptosporidium sp. chipmunk genotype I TaxID=1280935 RepID=UPI00351A2C95|nr:DHHC family palmitoyl transferase with a signal peptide and 4 transmembrane domains [Cryptosporidium sp. chipmunk genotype I]
MVRYKENDLSSYTDNPLGLLPSRFIVNSKNNWNITGIFVCILRLYAYYPVWLLLNNTSNDWYLNNAPFFIVYSLIFGMLNYTLYILISFGDPGYLKSCPSTKLKPVDKIRDPLKLKFNLELRNLRKSKNEINRNDTDNVFGSSEDEKDEELDEFDLEAGSINNLQTINESINNSSFEILNDRSLVDGICDSYTNDLNSSNGILRLGSSTTSFPLLNTSNLIKSPIRIDKSTANLSLVMESAPGQFLNSIGISQFSLNSNEILDNLLNNNDSECCKLSIDLLDSDNKSPESNFINGGNLNEEGSVFRLNYQDMDQKTPKLDKLTHPVSNLNSNSLSFPLSPCSSDGIDLLPRREIGSTNLKNSCFQSNDGYFVFKEGKMYQNGVRLRFCDYCRMYQPLRTKHCTSCERCIRTHDHHCPWLGVCIGEYNRCKFWWLSLVQFPECIWVLYCISTCLFKADLNGSRPTIFDICSMIFIAGNALFIAFLSLLLVVYHLFLAYNNLTTWENLAWNKISYLKPFPDTQNSPFSKGHIYNMAIFCIPYYVDDLIIGEEGEIIWERRPPNGI